MPTPRRPELRRLARRVHALLFARELTRAGCLLLVGLAVALLVVRLVAPRALASLTPNAWWLALLALPAAFAWLRTRERAPSEAALRLHLDRSLHLRGLLLADGEADATAWAAKLEAGLGEAARALPAIPWRRHLGRSALAGAFFAAVALLGPVVAPAASRSVLKEDQLAQIETRLEDLAARKAIDEQRAQEIEKRLEELERALARDGDVAWADVDALQAKLEQAQGEQALQAQRAQAALAALAQGEPGATSPANLAERLAQAASLDAVRPELAKALPPELLAKLGPAGLAADAEALQQALDSLSPQDLAALAKALAEVAGEALASLPQGLDGALPADLKQLLARLDGQSKPGHVHDADCAGGG